MTPPAPENSQIRLGSTTVIALRPSPHNARDIAHKLRCAGFYTLPDKVWSQAADLAEYLADTPPTNEQRLWLWTAHQRFLQ